jgi:hypothetical protein
VTSNTLLYFSIVIKHIDAGAYGSVSILPKSFSNKVMLRPWTLTSDPEKQYGSSSLDGNQVYQGV